MSRFQHQGGRDTRLMRLHPAGRTHAPLIAGLESRKTELGPRSAEVVADPLLKIEKLRRHMNTSGMLTRILPVRLTTPVTEKSGQWVTGAGPQRGSKYVFL